MTSDGPYVAVVDDEAMATNLLPSWNDGPARAAILDFVARVTHEGGQDYVPPRERIATFDNDGTLWCEQPLQVQVFFAQDRLRELAEKDSTIRDRQPYKAFLEFDLKTLHELGKKALFEIAFTTHAGELRTSSTRRRKRGWHRRSTPSLAVSSRNASTSRSSSCSTIFALTVSRRSSSRGAESTSCAPSPKRSTGFLPSR